MMRAAHKLDLLRNLLSIFKTLTHEIIMGWGGGGCGAKGCFPQEACSYQ